jgi:hypothetical protein
MDKNIFTITWLGLPFNAQLPVGGISTYKNLIHLEYQS